MRIIECRRKMDQEIERDLIKKRRRKQNLEEEKRKKRSNNKIMNMITEKYK